MRYVPLVCSNIGHLKILCEKELGINENSIMCDEFGNILMETIDLLEIFWPFFNFEVKGKPAKVIITYPYALST